MELLIFSTEIWKRRKGKHEKSISTMCCALFSRSNCNKTFYGKDSRRKREEGRAMKKASEIYSTVNPPLYRATAIKCSVEMVL